MVCPSGDTLSAEALRASREVAKASGSRENIEAGDFNGLRIDYRDPRKSLNLQNLKNKKGSITPEEFACFLQNIANMTRSPVVVTLSTGAVIKVQPAKGRFDRFVESLLRLPKESVPGCLSEYFRDNFRFELNSVSFAPQVFDFVRKGDCDDFSISAYYILKKTGYAPVYFQLFYPPAPMPGQKANAHDICIYRDIGTNRLNYFDEEGLHQVRAATLPEIFDDARPDWYLAQQQLITVKGDQVAETPVSGPGSSFRKNSR